MSDLSRASYKDVRFEDGRFSRGLGWAQKTSKKRCEFPRFGKYHAKSLEFVLQFKLEIRRLRTELRTRLISLRMKTNNFCECQAPPPPSGSASVVLPVNRILSHETVQRDPGDLEVSGCLRHIITHTEQGGFDGCLLGLRPRFSQGAQVAGGTIV